MPDYLAEQPRTLAIRLNQRILIGCLLVVAIFAAPAWPQTTAKTPRQIFLGKFVAAAVERTQHTVRYVPGYVHLRYPGGDVPADTGVCSDEVIRAYRAVEIDLQKEVHEDLVKDWDAYPHQLKWQQRKPDTSIDHRRVPNLMVFFSRRGENLPISRKAEDYAPGDIVTWDLGGDVPHIGMVVDRKSSSTGRLMIVHNIGEGPRMEDVLFNWKITGHYRYFGPGN
jgi:uncharacterized protein YijF (DUF1287 family)